MRPMRGEHASRLGSNPAPSREGIWTERQLRVWLNKLCDPQKVDAAARGGRRGSAMATRRAAMATRRGRGLAGVRVIQRPQPATPGSADRPSRPASSGLAAFSQCYGLLAGCVPAHPHLALNLFACILHLAIGLH